MMLNAMFSGPTPRAHQAAVISKPEKASRSELVAQSEDAVTFPREIPFPRKQSWH